MVMAFFPEILLALIKYKLLYGALSVLYVLNNLESLKRTG